MMQKGASKREYWINHLETGLLIVVVVGTVFAIQTQQWAWGLIPIALTMILNKIKQKNQQRSQQQRFQHLDHLIQNSQGEQENQQINLWKLQKQIEEWQDFGIEFRETQRQNTETIEEMIAELSQIQTQIENISVAQEQLMTDFNQLFQQQETLSQSLTNLNQQAPQNTIEIETKSAALAENQAEKDQLKPEFSTRKETIEVSPEQHSLREEIARLHSYLKQVTKLLDSVVKRQIEEKNTTNLITQQKIDHLHNCLEQLTELLNVLAQRQTEVSQTFKNNLSTLRDQL